jgi:hypothetical protein
LSSTDDTERLIAYLRTGPGTAMTLDLMADMGGDPQDYAIDDVAALSPSQFGIALQQGLTRAGEYGLLDPEIAALAASVDVDWAAVVAQVEASLWHGHAGP